MIKRTMVLAGTACTLLTGVASAQPYNYSNLASVSDSGISCRPQDGGKDFGAFSRSAKGIRNASTSNKRVFCQITPPVYDTVLGFQKLTNLIIFVTPSDTGAWPSCHAIMMTSRGVTTTATSSQAYWGYYTQTDAAIAISTQNLLRSPDTQPVSFAYSCDLPPNARIHGSFATLDIGGVVGGI